MDKVTIKAIEKAELNLLAGVGNKNAQSGIAKEFYLTKKRDFIKEHLLRFVKEMNEDSANYRKRHPKKLVSIYNNRKKDSTIRITTISFKGKIPCMYRADIFK